MVFWKFIKWWKESAEARDRLIETNRQKLETQAWAIQEQIKQDSQNAMAQNQANHDTEMNRRFEETLEQATSEIEEKYNEICTTISSVWQEWDDWDSEESEIDTRRAEMNRQMNERKIKRNASSLSIQVTFFDSFINNMSQRISIYWDVPADFVEDCDSKLAEIKKLIEDKQQEVGWE